MTTLFEETPPTSNETSRLRVVLLLRVHDGAERRFLDAYEHMRHQVAAVPGHISDQLCQSIEDPTQWLITSEWENAAPFLAWVDSPEHRAMVAPMHDCVVDTRSLRFAITRETSIPKASVRSGAARSAPNGNGNAAMAAHGGGGRIAGDGVARHALTFTVRPGHEREVAAILADYRSPESRVDETTRLLRTSLYMKGGRVVRAVEIEGDLGAALRHVAAQPAIRAVEEALNPHLEKPRDFTDPASAKRFFADAALPLVSRFASGGQDAAGLERRAFLYPARPGSGEALARLLTGQDERIPGAGDGRPAAAAVFRRDDVVVRIVDVEPGVDDLAVLLGVRDPGDLARLAGLLDLPDGVDPAGADGLRDLVAACEMTSLTDRRATSR